MAYQINDRAQIAGLPYRVYNVLYNGAVCFGRISAVTGADLSAKNPHNILTLMPQRVDELTAIGTITKENIK